MTDRSASPLAIACVVFATPWLVSWASAQEYPVPPPVPVRIAQAPQPTLIGPVLPGLDLPVQAPHPDELPPADPSVVIPETDIEAFARGPVHQAFADVYELDPVPNVIVTVAPPAAVDELPPEQAPTGENVQWISGYWSWDEESTDYLWVSGVWRDVPPGRRWVPGYWAEVKGGFQWVSGFWAHSESQDLAYLPPPPQSLEIGPNVPPPSDDQTWVPGNWTYVSNNYQWSPGYYTPCPQDYMWIPNQYNWTPRGCVYVSGYWDYRFARRGTLFSPVRFRHSLVRYGAGRPACYQPQYSVNMTGFLIHLFVRPSSRHFYYGDYYGNQYANLGYTPWYRRTIVNRHCHDPAYNFYRMDSHRQGLDFDRTVNTWHQRYELNRDIRPPRLMQDQDQFLARHHGDRSAQLAVTTHRFDDHVKQHSSGNAFHKMDLKELDLVRENSKVNYNLEVARRHAERDVNLVKSGDLKPGQAIDLRLKDGRDRTAGERHNRGKVLDATPVIPDKLVLGNLPEELKEKSKNSVATAERIRHPSEHRSEVKPSSHNSIDAIREQIKERNRTRQQADAARDREPPVQSGRTQLLNPPAIDDVSKPVVPDRVTGRPDRTPISGAPENQGSGAARLEELRQKLDAQRNARAAEASTKVENGPQVVTPTGRGPRILQGGPLVHPQADPPIERQPQPVNGDSSVKQRIEELRQQTEARRVARDAGNTVPRVAPTPREIENRQPRVIERAPQVELNAGKEHVIRERNIPPRIDNPAPVIRQPQLPMERAPKFEKPPIEHAPRHIERQVPVERAPPREVERRAPVERAPQSPRHEPPRRKGKD